MAWVCNQKIKRSQKSKWVSLVNNIEFSGYSLNTTFSRGIQHAISSAWAASSIITKSNEVLSSFLEKAPIKVVNITSALLSTSVTASCCLLRSSLDRVLSSLCMSFLVFLSLVFRSFPFNAWKNRLYHAKGNIYI